MPEAAGLRPDWDAASKDLRTLQAGPKTLTSASPEAEAQPLTKSDRPVTATWLDSKSHY
jgi:hypothetical protein